MFRLLRPRPQQCLRGVVVRHNSTAAPTAPPLLFKIKSDLKDAMRAKDTARLNVLRAIISETNNAAKTSSPIKTDIQLLKLLNKRTNALLGAKGEYLAADRADLVENANKEIEVLEGYAGMVEMISNEEVRAAVSRTIEDMKKSGKLVVIGTVIKTLVRPGGLLEGKPVHVGEISKIARELIS
ncbi:hypothetical protein EMPG_10809 [Blastomyces silverae]|uniref:Altered inheritance of mitochondria protein 41 n=1 Tax=Blastomyces silverae TaxID=2060906 RepID=A0A0H1B2P7_9EURO|nr:hypothetical protein EMPG_10809 [Blastomyces silverae]